MDTPNKKFGTVNEYFAAFPTTKRVLLRKMRDTIKEVAPDAEQVISYNMPAFKWNGILVWYAAYKEHIGLYPTPSAIKAFERELAGYKTSKGAIQFPVDKPVPTALVKKIVRFRIKQNLEKSNRKLKGRR